MEEYRKYEPIFGAWYLSRLIGKGSFGKVFEITREELGTTYRAALKIITIPQDEDDIRSRMTYDSDVSSVKSYYDGVLRDIVSENEIMSQLKGNTNIVSYEDHKIIPHEDGIGYDILIRMELLTPLLDRMAKGRLDEEEIIRLGIDMCTALGICHRKNIIHRDIKPQNIFITDNGNYKLGDFGIARTMEKTMGGMSRKGTYRYMAPEVFRAEEYDHTVDIYSLGIVLYTLLNENRGPFLPLPPASVSHNDEETANSLRFRGEPLPPPCNANMMLSYIVCKACAPNPADRYSNAEAMKNDLENYMINYGLEDDHTRAMEDYIFGSKAAARSNTGSYNTGSYPQDNAPRYTGSYPQDNAPRYTGSYPQDNAPRYTGSYPQDNAPRYTGSYPQDNVPRYTGSYPQGGMPGYTGQLTPEEAWRQEIINTRRQNEEREREEKKKTIFIVCAIVAVLLVAIGGFAIGRSLSGGGTGETADGQTPIYEDNGSGSSSADSGSNEGTDAGADGSDTVDTDTEDDTDVDTNGYADGLASEYLMPEANIRVYEKWEIADYDLTLTQRAINELYARHGYIFKEADVKQYFMGKSWYEPRFETIDPKTDFSDCEYKNYLLLVEQRDELK